jgi:putative transcriptional regulator
MNKKLFAELVESMTQMNEIARGEHSPPREFHIDALSVKARRSKLDISPPRRAVPRSRTKT